jgi:two-component system, chemotaxis family, chemotaxis protein CheY
MAYDLKAMVVDDDDHVRTFLVVLVRKLVSGTVFEARNGVEAIEVYESERPDIVLLDVNMPLMDGLEALAKMRQINPEVVVIMITSLAMRRVVEDALAGGALNFIRKDTPKAQMVEIIKETISCYLVPEEEEHADGAAAAD